ncbi:ribonuclease III [bacterium]|nr:ribonuclease III [bacterium]
MKLGRLPLMWKQRRKRRAMRPGAERTLGEFEKEFGYRFRDLELLERALTHRSILTEIHRERRDANERLEFLGDAVLDLVVCEKLYSNFPGAQEGYLARLKSLAVSGRQLASKARRMGLGAWLQVSDGEARNGGRTRRSILEDSLEAVIGAIYLDGGLNETRRFIERFVTYDVNSRLIHDREDNYKSRLLEYAQGQALGAPVYHVTGEEGPDHDKTFYVEVLVGSVPVGRGEGHSKKQAEQGAAREAVKFFGMKE